jgi:hypothetical protein
MGKQARWLWGAIVASIVVLAAIAVASMLHAKVEWKPSLDRALAGVDRVKVRTGGTCHRDPGNEKLLLDTSDASAIATLIGSIEINEAESGRACMCCGDPTIEFYRTGTLVVSLGVHHATALRWPEGKWPGDAMLPRESVEKINQWLKQQGVDALQQELDFRKQQAMQASRAVERAVRGLPTELQVALRTGNGFAERLKEVCPSQQQQVDALLLVHGSSNDSWTSLGWIEQMAEDLLKQFPASVLQAQTRTALLGQDRQRRRGAARLWMSWESPLENWHPDDAAQLRVIVVAVEQEARYAPLRQQAMTHLVSWKSAFNQDQLLRRLQMGLHDPEPQVRRQAMIAVGQTRTAALADQLMLVLKGSPLQQAALPEVPPEEQEDVPPGADSVAAAATDAEAAALALGWMEYRPAAEVIGGMAPTPMLEVAMALLGEQERLKASHFASPDHNTELQLAAVEAVVRCHGQKGLEAALAYSQARFWWEEEYVTRRLATALLKGDPPGQADLRNAVRMADLKAWYHANRPTK